MRIKSLLWVYVFEHFTWPFIQPAGYGIAYSAIRNGVA
jgi:hypothetical protein